MSPTSTARPLFDINMLYSLSEGIAEALEKERLQTKKMRAMKQASLRKIIEGNYFC